MERDSGLDIKNLEKVARLIKQELISKKVGVFIITHSGRILEKLIPDETSVMLEGKIVYSCRDYKKAIKTIRKHGYKKFK